MLLSIRRPSDATLARCVRAEASEQLTYPEVGATLESPPKGYTFDEKQTVLGAGEETFQMASERLFEWRHFQTDWTEIYPPKAAVYTGQTVAVIAHVWGIWTVHTARIITVIQEPRLHGFIYGTLPGHGESGEESFLIEWDDDDSVRYKVSAFFRPADWRVRLLWPMLRSRMDRFRHESTAVMQDAVR